MDKNYCFISEVQWNIIPIYSYPLKYNFAYQK